jgi:hypothetical protein
VLRVILELNDVAVAVVGFQQVRLGTTTHFPDEAECVYAHGTCGTRPGNGIGGEQEMSEENKSEAAKLDREKAASDKSRDEIALELMKFIAVTTGYGKGSVAAAGFSAKPSKTAEEYTEALLGLFERCRAVVSKPVVATKSDGTTPEDATKPTD